MFYVLSQKPSIPSSSRRLAANANPFNDNKETVRDIDRCSPNPFNPFNICDPNSRPTLPTPPPPTPPPPPRPPSRECPPVPPRNDLIRPPVELAPPLPRRRTTIDNKSNLEAQQSVPNRSIDPFSNNDNCSPPPIPNPQRKTQRKSNPNWDPFNCAFVESQLSSIASNSSLSSNKVLNNLSDNELNSSTPKTSTDYVPPLRQDLKLSEIHSPYTWIETNDEIINDQISTSSGTPVFVDDFVVNSSNNNNNINSKSDHESNNKLISGSSVQKQNIFTEEEDRDNHISPPERNIFIVKSDPFADEFFAD